MFTEAKRIIVFHPFLFAIYFVLGAYSQNASQVPIGWIARPLIFLTLFTFFIFFCLEKRFRNDQYSGFITTLFLNWIFMGHLYRLFLSWSSFWRTALGGLCAFFLITLPFGLLARQSLWKKLSNPRAITTFFNMASIVLVILPLWITLNIFYKGSMQQRSVRELQSASRISLPSETSSHPDIYWIILDGYGRADLLKDLYGYDDTQFISFLRQKGFYVADRATANYPQTQLSLSSTLNLQYLNESVRQLGTSSDRSALYELVQHPVLRQVLKNEGYKFVALPSATLATQVRDADLYLSLTPGNINEFESLLLSTTVLGVATEAWGVDLPVQSYELHRQYILFSLQKLREAPRIPGPKFVFAHIMLPHPPFIFDHDGNFTPPAGPYIMWDASLFPGTTEEYEKGYTEQINFLNQEMVTIISDILARSANPPIIIVQGDHGPGAFFDISHLENNSCLDERFSILNAYYFPDGDYRLLYPSITPVNSFRVILDQYFGASLELLKDRSYYASWTSPYKYTDVTDSVHLACGDSEQQMH